MASRDSADSNYVEWRSKSLSERNALLFNKQRMSDVSFVCGKSIRVIYAHKHILSIDSPVFEKMCFGELAEKQLPIRIEDANEESFVQFLHFFYRAEDCEIAVENAREMMYLAKKYLVSSLEEKCCKFLEENINPDYVFEVLEIAIQFDEKDLESECWDVVFKKTVKCINSEAFCTIGLDTLIAFLKQTGTLPIVELFEAVLKWADSQCARKVINVEKDKTARRRVLGDSVYEIPFPALSLKYFVKYVSPTGILTDSEIVAISQQICGLVVPAELKWKDHVHGEDRLVRIGRFDPHDVDEDSLFYVLDKTSVLTFTVNKTVIFHGVRLFGDRHGSTYKITFTINDVTITRELTSRQDPDGVWWYDVMLQKPMSLPPDEEVTMTVTIEGPESYKGRNGKPEVQVDDIVVRFIDAFPGSSINRTSKTEGQFYKIFLSKL